MVSLRAGYWWKVSAGLFSGIIFGAMLSIIAGVIRVIAGAARFEGRIGSFGKLVLLYLVGGVLSGLIGGVLHPFGRTSFGACGVGVIAAGPLSLIFGAWVFGPVSSWTSGEIVMSVAWTIGVGVYAGYQIRRMILTDPDLSDW